MRTRMPGLWTLGGLSLSELFSRTIRESWQDDVFGQSGRMAFYHFLAIFPCLFVLFAISQRVPHLGEHLKHALADLARQVLPDQVSQLVKQVITQLNRRTRGSVHFLPVCAGALWAALNGTWAMIYGLNKAYEVQEQRSWRKISLTLVGLTASLAVTGLVAVFLIFCSSYLESRLDGGVVVLRILEWLVLVGSLSLSFAVLYRFAPNLRNHAWRWSTPGALLALVLWIGSTFLVRAYFNHVNDYSRSYGPLNGVVMLLLWLYVTNGAILIGAEMNSEIEKAAAEGTRKDPRHIDAKRRSGS